MNLKLAAVTACISGVAHTYMAAKQLEKLCQQKKWQIQIETQGAFGIENTLTQEMLNQIDVVILIADIPLHGQPRFMQKRCVHINTSNFLQHPEKVIQAIKKLSLTPQGTQFHIV